MPMYVYALSYPNPHGDPKPMTLFVASARLVTEDEALAAAVDAVINDSLGNEWVEAVTHASLCGPLEIEGQLRHPSIAVVVD